MEQLEKHALPYISYGMKKSEIEQLANMAVESVLEDGNITQIAEALSCMEKFVEAVKKDARFVDYLRDELAKNKGKITTSSGAKLESAEVGTKYVFDNCNDPVYTSLLAEKEVIATKIKERETFLKAIPEQGMEIRHEDELVLIFKPNKTSTSSYKITLAK